MGSMIEFQIAGPATEDAPSLNLASHPWFSEIAAARRT